MLLPNTRTDYNMAHPSCCSPYLNGAGAARAQPPAVDQLRAPVVWGHPLLQQRGPELGAARHTEHRSPVADGAAVCRLIGTAGAGIVCGCGCLAGAAGAGGVGAARRLAQGRPSQAGQRYVSECQSVSLAWLCQVTALHSMHCIEAQRPHSLSIRPYTNVVLLRITHLAVDGARLEPCSQTSPGAAGGPHTQVRRLAAANAAASAANPGSHQQRLGNHHHTRFVAARASLAGLICSDQQ